MAKPLRILFVSLNQPWQGGGTFYRAFGFAKHLVRQGHDVTLLTTSVNNRWHFQEETVEGVRLLQAPALLPGMLRSGWDPYEILRRRLRLRNECFDLIHGFETRPVVIYTVLALQRQCNATLILDWCDWFGRGGHVEQRPWWLKPWLRPIETYYEEHFRTCAHGTTVINSALRQRAIELGVAPETLHWLPNGAETEAIQVLERSAARRALGLSEKQVLIGHLGQAFPPDEALMLNSFACLKQSRPDARLMLIGNHRIQLAQEPNGDAIVDVGYVTPEALNLYLGACDLLWMPLRDTGMNRRRWPMKINDYMAAGRATVSTGVGDLVQLFEGEEAVGCLAPDEPGAFAAQTEMLLADAERRKRYEQNARRVVETRFDWKRVTRALEAFYKRTMQDVAPPV